MVTQSEKIKSKLANRGTTCLYLGNAETHIAGVAYFIKLSTKRVIRSRGIKWLNKIFHEYQRSEGLYEDNDAQDSESNIDSSEDENGDLDTSANETKETAVRTLGRTRSGINLLLFMKESRRRMKEIKRLIGR